MRSPLNLLLSGAVFAGLSIGLAWAQGWHTTPLEVDGRRSGYLYLGEQTQALQDDDFLNPGMFAVDAGRALWNQPDGQEGFACASCHGNAEDTMISVATSYPRYDETRGGIVNLELMINRDRVERMGAEPFEYESDELLSLTAYISHQSRGLPWEVDVTGPAAPFFEEGRDFFFERRGQLDLSCAQCHSDNEGMFLRGDLVSQGQTTGFPFYRLMWGSMGSTHRMFEWCNISVRAEPYPLGSNVYLSLELYVAWRGRGLPIETPAVRR